jgi:hypothetical protein
VDAAQTLTVSATAEQSTQSASVLTFSYAGATTGANAGANWNTAPASGAGQYVSCVLEQSGQAVYYARLADSSAAASGALSVPLSGVADGVYTLKIFSEEDNGENYADYSSAPVCMTLSVAGGTGTVSNFGGTILASGSEDAGDADSGSHVPVTGDETNLALWALAGGLSLVAAVCALRAGRAASRARV